MSRPNRSTSAHRAKSERLAVIQDRERKLRGMTEIQQKENEMSSVCAGIFVLVFSFSITTTCIVIAAVYEINDLYIVGGLFGLASFILTILLLVSMCKPLCQRHSLIAGQKELAEIEAQINREFGVRRY